MTRTGILSRARSESDNGVAVIRYLWSSLAGLLIPILVVMIGLIAVLLSTGGLTVGAVRLGTHLYVPVTAVFAEQSALVQLTELVIVSLAIAIVFALSLWLQRLSVNRRVQGITKRLHKQVLAQSIKRAEVEGAAAQAVQAAKIIDEHLPELGRGLSLWYRAVPRAILTFIGCIVVALLVNVWLAMLAIVSGIILWQLFTSLRRNEQSELINWEVPRARRRMVELVGQAPLLARLKTAGITDKAFDAELEAMYRRTADEEYRLAKIWPILFASMAVSIAVIVLGLGVNVDSGLSLPSAMIIGLALLGAALAVGRLLKLRTQLTKSSEASNSIYQYLEVSNELSPTEKRVGLIGLRNCVELQNVTIGASQENPVLGNVSLKLLPKTMVALLGTDSTSSRALVEMLMGFGTPQQGRVSIDGIQIRDIHPAALTRNVMWIAPDGPIFDGSLEENLRGDDQSINNGDMVKALEKVNVYERLIRLPEGLGTFVTAGDSMLGTEATYAIGVARALLHKPAIVLASEPPPPAEHLADDPCLSALQALRDSGSLVVILPHRLQTLRQADRVVLLNGPRIAGEGTHATLLSDSDLYRHLNYLLFNPYRHMR